MTEEDKEKKIIEELKLEIEKLEKISTSPTRNLCYIRRIDNTIKPSPKTARRDRETKK